MRMKTLLFCLVSTFYFLIPTSSFAQGSLTPPGAPAPTMKTLAQIEPRTPISSLPFTISSSGSYYLTQNLSVSSGNAITVDANQVTLDLNGFTISSTANPAVGTGVFLAPGLTDITILNGHIKGGVTQSDGVYSGSGFRYGIFYSGQPPANARVTGVSVSGCLSDGINLNSAGSTVVESCTVRTVGGNGIVASTVKTSVALVCGISGIEGIQVSDCRGNSTGFGGGVAATTALNCYGISNDGTGVLATTVQNCSGISGSGDGVYASRTAENCCGFSSSGTGLNAAVANNCYGSSGNGIGLSATNVAIGCYGQSSSGSAGLSVVGIASYCSGSSSGGTAITCAVAIGCSSFGGTINAPQGKFLGTP